jgi:predicted MFS family arabinose efflux permease
MNFIQELRGVTRNNRLVAFSLFCWGLGEGLFIYIEPLYLKELGADPLTIGSVLAAAATAAAIGHIPAGYLVDRFSPKPLLVAGWSLGTLACLVMFLARDLRVFVPALIAYTFTGFVIAPINAYVSQARGKQSVQRALTLVSAGFWAGSVISPAVGGTIAELVGLRTVFGVAVGIFVVSTIAIMLLAPQPRQPISTGGWRYARLFGNQRFLSFLGLVFIALLAMQVGMPFAPNFIVEVRGFDVALVGVLGSVNSFGNVALNLLVGQRLPRRAFMLAQAFMALSMSFLLLGTSSGWLLAAYFLRSGWNLARNMAAAQVGRVVNAEDSGMAYGLTETVAALAAIGGPLAAGLLYARNPAWPFQTSLLLVLLSLPLVWAFAPRRDAHTETV